MHTPSEGQELAIDYATKNKYSIIAMPPGQGKTLVPVEMAKRKNLNTLVVCPSYAKKVWVTEFKNQFEESPIHITLFKKGSDLYPLWDDGVAIISYSLLVGKSKDKQKNKEKDELLDSIFEWADQVVLDESQLIKEMENKTTVKVHKLIFENRVPYVTLLSGTPAKNRVHELYSQISLCHYKHDHSPFLEKYETWIDFAEKFSVRHIKKVKVGKRTIPSVTYSGIKEESKQELKQILNTCYFRLPDKYLHKLPPRYFKYIEADDLPDVPELYDEFIEFIEENKGVSSTLKAQSALVTAGFTGVFACDMIDKHGQVVVFTDHVDSANRIAQVCSRRLKQEITAIHGEVPLKKRQEILKSFQNGNEDVIVATIQTLSTAISLTNSQCMVLNDSPWTPGDLEQTERRIARRGQNSTCYYYRVLATKQSEYIYKVLDKKKKDLKTIDELAR